MKFLEELKKTIRAPQARIVFAESDDERILEAVVQIRREGFAIPVLLGESDRIHAKAKEQELDLGNIEVTPISNASQQDELAALLYERRRHKGMTPEKSLELVKNPLYFGGLLVESGKVDAMIAGASNTTADILKTALHTVGTGQQEGRVSSVFLLEKEDTLLFFADCAVNIEPSAEELAHITLSTAETVEKLGIEPRIALLSFSTHGSATHPLVTKVQTALQISKSSRPDLMIDGELQFDAAFIPEIRARKAPGSLLTGAANVFIFPDLNSANIGYKIAERLGGFTTVGPLLQGLKKPIHDLSRGCKTEDIVNMAIITAHQI